MLNDSSSEHKISQKYDSDLDILRSYVDDAEKVSPRLMPDYANAVVFYTLEDSDRPTTHKSIYLYTAPSNGFIRIVDCFTAQDYFIYVNNSTDDYGTYARGHSAYHKCGSSLSCSGMFPITKGDVITMVAGPGQIHYFVSTLIRSKRHKSLLSINYVHLLLIRYEIYA